MQFCGPPFSFRPSPNPTFGNPSFEDAPVRVLIVRLSPLRDVETSFSHLFLFHEVRRALPEAYVDMLFFPPEDSSPVGVQSRRPLRDFSTVLISNAYTLELINLPVLLGSSGLPLFAGERGEDDPVLILGGSNAMAAQAAIREDRDALVDGIFFGEGEGRVGEIVAALARGGGDRRARLETAAQTGDGLWVAGSRQHTVKAVCRPAPHLLPVTYPILNTPEAHTAYLQITWGCPAFCSFCFEGYDRKPYRELPAADLVDVARQLKRIQGAEEVSLYSFNFNTHGEIFDLLLELHRLFDRVGLKSQRADILLRTPGLLEAELAAEKREITLGIEGISARQRAFLHKSLASEDIVALLSRLLEAPIRRIKLFYVLTGYEGDEDLAEFRGFVRWLRDAHQHSPARPRIIFSFGRLVRMPFTPFRYDRLFLEERDWRPIVGAVKSACDMAGFEFRLAADWPEYLSDQVLALGGYWLVEPLIALARQGFLYDGRFPRRYGQELRAWAEKHGHWTADFLGEKGLDYPFPLEFVQTDVPAEFVYRQYQEARAGMDRGYCLGDGEGPGRCLGCGACPDEETRRAITHHRIRLPDAGYLTALQETVSRKRRLRPLYYRFRVGDWLTGVLPEFLNAFVFRQLLTAAPELTDNLLSVREALFTVLPNDRRFPVMGGETVFALRAWDADGLAEALGRLSDLGDGVEALGPAEDFRPGVFSLARVELFLPGLPFAEGRAALEQYLRGAYVPFSLRREGEAYGLDIPSRGQKKKILFGGRLESRPDGFFAVLEVGPKGDLMNFLRRIGDGRATADCRVRVLMVK